MREQTRNAKFFVALSAAILGGVVVAFLLFGCGNVEVSKVTPENPDAEGIRFYRSHPYLWVTKDEEGVLQGTILWLPNKKEEYVIKMNSGIGKVDGNFTLEGGWNLTQFGATQDSQTAETITALSGSLKDLGTIVGMKAPGERSGKEEQKEELLPGLYRFVYDEETGHINGLQPVVQFGMR